MTTEPGPIALAPRLDALEAAVRARSALVPRLALVLGSGLGGLADAIEDGFGVAGEARIDQQQVLAGLDEVDVGTSSAAQPPDAGDHGIEMSAGLGAAGSFLGGRGHVTGAG